MSYNLTGLQVNRSARDAMDALPPPPLGIDLTDDRRLDIVATSVITWLVAIVITGLRIMSRRVKGIHLWLDDWLIISSLVRRSCLSQSGATAANVMRSLSRLFMYLEWQDTVSRPNNLNTTPV
jgi:hypothetical protein